jgi:hypothetical protein
MAHQVRGRKPEAWNNAKAILEEEGLGYDGPRFKTMWSVYVQSARDKNKDILDKPPLRGAGKGKHFESEHFDELVSSAKVRTEDPDMFMKLY